MASLLLTACLSLSAAALVRGDNEITWGSVVFTYHGEKIPALHEGPYNLTRLGANQLLQAGQTIRNRYISGPSNGSQITGSYPIARLSVNDIDNSQMEVMTMTDEYITASALAFMQGLYPPRSTATEVVDEESIMGNGTLEQFPLNGKPTTEVEHSPPGIYSPALLQIFFQRSTTDSEILMFRVSVPQYCEHGIVGFQLYLVRNSRSLILLLL